MYRTQTTLVSPSKAEVTLLSHTGTPLCTVEVGVESLPGINTLLKFLVEAQGHAFEPGEPKPGAEYRRTLDMADDELGPHRDSAWVSPLRI